MKKKKTPKPIVGVSVKECQEPTENTIAVHTLKTVNLKNCKDIMNKFPEIQAIIASLINDKAKEAYPDVNFLECDKKDLKNSPIQCTVRMVTGDYGSIALIHNGKAILVRNGVKLV